MLRISALDQSPVPSGSLPAGAILTSLSLAQFCDKLGYHRYWLAEHHASAALAGTAPEILIQAIAQTTRRIRVGAGGIMLSHYSPLKVAEVFKVLCALNPGRIDLGLGRAPGSDGMTARALNANGQPLGPDQYPRQVVELVRYLYDAMEPDHPYAQIRANPGGAPPPEIWLLGSSDQSALLAAEFGLSCSFAHFINPNGGPEVMDAYRQRFRQGVRPAPQGNVAVFAIAADTTEEAQYLSASRDLFLLRLGLGGDPGPYPTPEEALAYDYSPQEMAYVRAQRRRGIVGNPAEVKAGIEALAETYGVDEVVVVTICHDQIKRRRSYELIAAAFGLDRQP